MPTPKAEFFFTQVWLTAYLLKYLGKSWEILEWAVHILPGADQITNLCADFIPNFCADYIPNFVLTKFLFRAVWIFNFCADQISNFCADQIPNFCADQIPNFSKEPNSSPIQKKGTAYAILWQVQEPQIVMTKN